MDWGIFSLWWCFDVFFLIVLSTGFYSCQCYVLGSYIFWICIFRRFHCSYCSLVYSFHHYDVSLFAYCKYASYLKMILPYINIDKNSFIWLSLHGKSLSILYSQHFYITLRYISYEQHAIKFVISKRQNFWHTWFVWCFCHILIIHIFSIPLNIILLSVSLYILFNAGVPMS